MNLNSEYQSLSDRLERLESQNRRWKAAAALFAVATASLVLIAARTADHPDSAVIRGSTIEAKTFLVTDAQGHVRVRLSLGEALSAKQVELAPNRPFPGNAALQFFDPDGKVVLTVPTRPQFTTVN